MGSSGSHRNELLPLAYCRSDVQQIAGDTRGSGSENQLSSWQWLEERVGAAAMLNPPTNSASAQDFRLMAFFFFSSFLLFSSV